MTERTHPSPRQALVERATLANIPLGVHFELTKRCNLRCYHCYVVEQEVELPTTRWIELAHEVAQAGCLSVSLTGGEMCLREDWLEIARAVRHERMVLGLLTNGTLLGQDEIEAIAELSPSFVAVSLYGADAATHDAVTLTPGSFARTLVSLKALRAMGVRCRVNTVLMRETFDSYEDVKRLATEMGCSFTFDYTVSPKENGDCGATCSRISDEQLRQVIAGPDGPLHLIDEELTDPVRTATAGRAGACKAGRSRGWIGADGQVLPCMGLPAFGDASTTPFDEVWRSERAEAMRKQLTTPSGACQTCALAHWCTTWCPRLAMMEGGGISAEADRACHLAAITREQWYAGAGRSKALPLEYG